MSTCSPPSRAEDHGSRAVAAAELVAAGASEARRDGMDDYGWVVLADPEGNVFCVSSAGR